MFIKNRSNITRCIVLCVLFLQHTTELFLMQFLALFEEQKKIVTKFIGKIKGKFQIQKDEKFS